MSCSDDDPVQPEPVPTQKGPFVIDFEDRPDDGFVGKTPPITIAPGVTVSAVLPSGVFYDFKPSFDGWGLGGCSAMATSDTMMIAFQGSGNITAVFTFSPAVSRVDAFIGVEQGKDAIMTAFDSSNNVVGADTVSSVCPMLDINDRVSISVGSNKIAKIEVGGGVVLVMDDLSFFRFE